MHVLLALLHLHHLLDIPQREMGIIVDHVLSLSPSRTVTIETQTLSTKSFSRVSRKTTTW
jgi:hypothetical protein